MAGTMLKEDVVCKAARSLGLGVKKVHRRISMEEFNERWSNLRLCMFCGEQETPYHHLQHKNEVILMIECDDDQTFDDKEETDQVHETLTNPAPIEEDVSSDQICDEKELVSIDLDLQEVQTKTVAEEKLNLPNGQNIEHLVGKNFETFSTEYSSFLNLSSSNGYQKDSTWIESSLYLLCSLKDGRVWEPGGLPNKMDLWDWPETRLKPCGESQQVETFLYSLMQVVKRNLEFKTFESNKTFSLEDEQDDEPEQNQVIKLISLWNNHIWEPGGVLIEHDKWNWLEKCYSRGRLMRLMHWMSSIWSKETKSRESERLSAGSCVDIKTWHCVKHETQQIDFHVWHRWKNKAEKLPEDYAFLELMMLGLVSFQSNKGNGLVGLVPKAIRLMLVGRFSGGGIKEVSLGCLGIHNMKLKEEVDICFRNLRCLITHSVLETTKLHEISSLMSLQKNAEMTTPLAKETQGWIVNTWCMIQRMIVSVWKSFGYLMEAHGSKYKGLGCVVEKKKLRNVEDGVKQDKNRLSGDVRAKIFMALEELHLLQDVLEMVKELLLKTSLISPQVMRNTKLKFTKQWMFKFRKKKIDQWLDYNLIVAYLGNKKTWAKLRVREHDNLTWKEDASDESRSRSSCCIVKLGGAAITSKNVLEKIYDENLEIMAWSKRLGRSEFSCEVDDLGEISTFNYQAEAVSATQQPAIFQSANAHGMITRGKEGIVKTNLRYSLLAVQRVWEKETHDVDITDAYYVLQEEFEQVENHTPCSVVKLERPQDYDALLLPFPGDERFQIKHKWRFKLLLSILELKLYLDSLVLISSEAHQFDIISLIILMRVELSVSSLQNQMDSSSLQTLRSRFP